MPVILTFQYTRVGGWSTGGAHDRRGCVWLIRLTEFNHRVPVHVSRTKRGEKKKGSHHYIIVLSIERCIYYVTPKMDQ